MIMRYEAYFIYCFILYAFALLDYQEYKCESCKPGFYYTSGIYTGIVKQKLPCL